MADSNLPTLPGSTPQRQGDSDAGFLESTFSAMTRELVGLDPRMDVRRYRAQNPTLGMTSQILGEVGAFAVPFTRVGQAAARAAPLFGRGVRAGERIISEGRPVLGQIGRDISTLAPFEAGRIGTSVAVGGDTSEVIAESALEFGAVGLGTGIIAHLSHALPGAGRATQFETQVARELDPEFNMNAPPQVKMQRLSNIRDSIENEGIRDEMDRHIAKYASEVRYQDIPERRRAVQKVVSPNENENRRLSKKLSEMFDVQDGKNRTVRKLVKKREDGGFGGKKPKAGIDDFLKRAGMPFGWEKHSFLPRYMRVKTADQARRTQKTLNEMSSPVMAGGRQTWITQETSNGAYVITRRAKEGTEPIEAGEEFISFKTDNPEFFGPELGSFNRVMDENLLTMEAGKKARKSEGSVTQAYDQLADSLPDVGVISGEMVRGTSGGTIARRISEAIIGEERVGQLRHAFGSATDAVGQFTREFAAPTINRYGGKNGNALAASISLTSKAIWDAAQLRSTRILGGKLSKNYKNAIYKDIFQGILPESRRAPGSARVGGLFQMIDDLPDEAMPDITKAFRQNLSTEDMRGMNPQAVEFMKRLETVDRQILDDFNKIMRDLDDTEFQGMANHYMLSRMWEGKFRIPIRKKNGNVVAVASGRSSKQALEEAERLKKIIDEEGDLPDTVSFNPREVRRTDQGGDLDTITEEFGEQQVRNNISWLRRARDPERFSQREGVRGFKFEREDFTHKDLRTILGRQVREMYELAASRTIDNRLSSARVKLKNEDPHFSRMLESELMARTGQRGAWSRATEEAVDRVLTPVFGQSAAEIVRAVNNGLFQLTLGMGNVGFAALNALTFLQTALPEVAWLMKAPPDRIRPLYGANIVKTPRGMGIVHSPSPLKFMQQGFKDMSDPPDELWNIYLRAKDEGRVAPVLSEEVFGPNSDIIKHMKGFFKEHRTTWETIQEISAYLPARTEELSRSMALSMGYRVGKDFMGLAGEDLYQFATRFVDNTHFRYTSADRPQLLRGAFGSLLGLFKSWMLHYIGNMTRYGGEAFRQGNFGPLLWSQAGTMSMAGLSGTAALPLAEGMHSLMTEEDKPLAQTLYEGLGWDALGVEGELTSLGSPADGLYFGIPAFLNMSLSHRAAVPGADIPNDIEQLYSVMLWDRAVAMGDLIGSSIDAAYATGEHPAQSQAVRDAMYRAFLPATAQAFVKRTNEGGMRSLRTQNKLLSDVTWSETALNVIGFQPNRLARTYEMMDVMFERQQERQEAISAFGEQLNQAVQDGDSAMIQNVLMRAQYAGIPIDRIMSSYESRANKQQEALIERQFDDLRNLGLRRALGGE